MLNEPHYPSKWTAIAVFFVILLMMAGVFAWAFYFNLGTYVFRSDQSFSLLIDNEMEFCEDGVCQITLPPGVYPATASREGYYDEDITVRFERLQTLDIEITFELVPYLNADRAVTLPDEVVPSLSVRENGDESLLVDVDTGSVVTRFESLEDPTLRIADSLALVIDTGRLFFVNLVTGRKERRFDDSVVVEDALISDDGSRSVLFVRSQGLEQLWLYYHESEQLSPMTWNADPQFVQWEAGSADVLYVVTDQLQESQSPSLFADLLQVTPTGEQGIGLFQVNFDNSQVRELQRFEENELPVALYRRGTRYFVEYDSDRLEELVIQ